MFRDWLESTWPCFLALPMAFLAARVLIGVSGGRFNCGRLMELHRCQRGGVQSLAFVLTLPLFIIICLFIVQVSQLMIAQMVLHYAAFAGARAASVWIAAAVDEPPDNPNCDRLIDEDDYWVTDPVTGQSRMIEIENRLGVIPLRSGESVDPTLAEAEADSPSAKLRKIRAAVVQACAPLAPSRDLGAQPVTPEVARAIPATQNMYTALVLNSTSNNPRLLDRIARKLSYTDAQTQVFVEWLDSRDPAGRDSLDYRAYNVRNHPNPRVQYHPNEVGWQDPVTVYVVHQYALLPGPGRLLARQLVRADGLPDRVSQRISTTTGIFRETLYTTQLQASATIVNEGIKSIRPYVQAE
jgi:hypothetical protein